MKKLVYLFFLIIPCSLVACTQQARKPASVPIVMGKIHTMGISKEKENASTSQRNSDDLWQQLPSGFSLVDNKDIENDPHVQTEIRWFLSHKLFLQRLAKRAEPYLYYIHEEISKRNLPAELTLLPVIESAFNPFTSSNAGAAGLWQIMPGTATGFGVKRNWWYDGRRDVVASTNAALNYLAYLNHYFDGDWLLAIAAYNTGPGNVKNAMHKNAKAGRPTDFWHLSLSKQTMSYVPRLLAFAVILQNPDKYPIELPSIPNQPYLSVIKVGQQIDLNQAANLAGIDIEELHTLNPGYQRFATDPNGPSEIIVPIHKAKTFQEALSSLSPDELLKWQIYQVKPGDSLSSIARKFHTSSQVISEINHLSGKSIGVGKMLRIPAAAKTARPDDFYSETLEPEETAVKTVSEKLNVAAKSKTKTVKVKVLKSVKSITYTVIPGDSLKSIAKKLHSSSQAIMEANQLTSSSIRTGQKLVIPL